MLFRHFIEHVRDLAGSVYGRRTYEVMRVWDEDFPEWGAQERDFAAAWSKVMNLDRFDLSWVRQRGRVGS